MARKYDRYGRNRQFRRNPTRNTKFFPYQLPFQSDFRQITGNGTEVSAATAAHWRQVVADITHHNKRKRDDDDDGLYERMQYTQTPIKNARNSAFGAIGDSLLATGLTRAAQGELRKDIAEIALRTAIISGMIAI